MTAGYSVLKGHYYYYIMETDKMNVSDLLADESFINFCKRSSPEDVAFWETYIIENPDRRLILENAKENFVQLFNVLAEADRDEQETRLKNTLNLLDSEPLVQIDGLEERKSKKGLPLLLKITAVAAVLLAAILLSVGRRECQARRERLLSACRRFRSRSRRSMARPISG